VFNAITPRLSCKCGAKTAADPLRLDAPLAVQYLLWLGIVARLFELRRLPRPCDDGQFVQHNRRVLDEDRVGQIRLGRHASKTDAQSRKAFFVASMFLDRFGYVNLLTRKECQLAIGETGGDGASDCCERSLLQFIFAALTPTRRASS
jgi:hypothetical protein